MRLKSRISAVSREAGDIFIHDPAGGTTLSCTRTALRFPHEFDLLGEGTLVEYEQGADGITDLHLIDEDDEQALLFVEPPQFRVLGRPPFEDCELFDYGRFILARGARDEVQARARLIDLCREVGANAVIDYDLREETRASMGFGFRYYYACGVPAVVAARCDQGEVSVSELRSRLDHDRIRRLGNMLTGIRVARLTFRILALVLFGVFAIGFLLSP